MNPSLEPSTVQSADSAGAMIAKVYTELRDLAARHLRKLRPGQTLQPTAVVHEAYLKLAAERPGGWGGQSVFLTAAAQALRDVVVDHVRRRAADKRGGDRLRISFYDADAAVAGTDGDVLNLDEALKRLAARDPQMSELVTLRYFAGATMEQAAEALGISLATANRAWRFAKAWLMNELREYET